MQQGRNDLTIQSDARDTDAASSGSDPDPIGLHTSH
jgi:hypothetical protein